MTSTNTGNRTLSGVIGIANLFTPGTNAYTTTGSTVDFNGNTDQTIPVLSYVNLTASGSGVKTIANNITISNNLNVSGTATLASDIYQISRTAAGGTFTLGAGTALTLGRTYKCCWCCISNQLYYSNT